jgi:hypothetical protein
MPLYWETWQLAAPSWQCISQLLSISSELSDQECYCCASTTSLLSVSILCHQHFTTIKGCILWTTEAVKHCHLRSMHKACKGTLSSSTGTERNGWEWKVLILKHCAIKHNMMTGLFTWVKVPNILVLPHTSDCVYVKSNVMVLSSVICLWMLVSY